MQTINPLEQAKRQWKAASANHVASTAGVRQAKEAVAHLQSLIANEQAQLNSAKTGQRASILAAFGLRTDAPEQTANVTEIQARIDVLESVLPEHEAAVQQAQAVHATTDAAVRKAEQDILNAKAALAIEAEAKAFAAFQEAHLHCLAVGAALHHRDMTMKLAPGYWTTRIYGDRFHIDCTAPGLNEACAELIALAEQGK